MSDSQLSAEVELAEAAKAFREIAGHSFAPTPSNSGRGSTLLPDTIAGALLAPTFDEPSFRKAVGRVLAGRNG